LDTGRTEGDQPRDEDLFGLSGYLKKKPACPAGGAYEVNPIGDNARCSIPGHQL
jgi:hypothetical protein